MQDPWAQIPANQEDKGNNELAQLLQNLRLARSDASGTPPPSGSSSLNAQQPPGAGQMQNAAMRLPQQPQPQAQVQPQYVMFNANGQLVPLQGMTQLQGQPQQVQYVQLPATAAANQQQTMPQFAQMNANGQIQFLPQAQSQTQPQFVQLGQMPAQPQYVQMPTNNPTQGQQLSTIQLPNGQFQLVSIPQPQLQPQQQQVQYVQLAPNGQMQIVNPSAQLQTQAQLQPNPQIQRPMVMTQPNQFVQQSNPMFQQINMQQAGLLPQQHPPQQAMFNQVRPVQQQTTLPVQRQAVVGATKSAPVMMMSKQPATTISVTADPHDTKLNPTAEPFVPKVEGTKSPAGPPVLNKQPVRPAPNAAQGTAPLKADIRCPQCGDGGFLSEYVLRSHIKARHSGVPPTANNTESPNQSSKAIMCLIEVIRHYLMKDCGEGSASLEEITLLLETNHAVLYGEALHSISNLVEILQQGNLRTFFYTEEDIQRTEISPNIALPNEQRVALPTVDYISKDVERTVAAKSGEGTTHEDQSFSEARKLRGEVTSPTVQDGTAAK